LPEFQEAESLTFHSEASPQIFWQVHIVQIGVPTMIFTGDIVFAPWRDIVLLHGSWDAAAVCNILCVQEI